MRDSGPDWVRAWLWLHREGNIPPTISSSLKCQSTSPPYQKPSLSQRSRIQGSGRATSRGIPDSEDNFLLPHTQMLLPMTMVCALVMQSHVCVQHTVRDSSPCSVR